MKTLLFILFLTSTAYAQQTTDCPSADLRFCFQCSGSQTIYSCCANPASATGYACAVATCSNPQQVDCSVHTNPLQATNEQLKILAYHPNGQSYKDHWNACALNNFQLWTALRGGKK